MATDQKASVSKQQKSQIAEAIEQNNLRTLEKLLKPIKEQAQDIIINPTERTTKNYQGPQSYNLLEYALHRWENKNISKYLIDKMSFKPSSSNLSVINYNKPQARDALNFLKKHKIDIDVPDKFGMRPIHNAIAFQKDKLLKNLIEQGANVNKKESLDRSPLEVAVEYSNDKAVSMLLTKGADLNAKDKNGNTILHKIAMSNNTSLMDTLIKGKYITKESLLIKNKLGQTPLDIAKQEQQKRVDKTFTNEQVQELFNDNKLIARVSRFTEEMPFLHSVRDSDGTYQNIDRSGNRNRSATLLVPGNKKGIRLFDYTPNSIFLYNSDNTTIRGYSLINAVTKESQSPPTHLFYNLSEQSPKLTVPQSKFSDIISPEFIAKEDLQKSKEYEKVAKESKDRIIKESEQYKKVEEYIQANPMIVENAIKYIKKAPRWISKGADDYEMSLEPRITKGMKKYFDNNKISVPQGVEMGPGGFGARVTIYIRNHILTDNEIIEDLVKIEGFSNKSQEYLKAQSTEHFARYFNEKDRDEHNEILVNIFPDSITGIVCTNDGTKLEGLKAQYYAAEKYGYDLPIFNINEQYNKEANIQLWNPIINEIFKLTQKVYGSNQKKDIKESMLSCGIILDEKNPANSTILNKNYVTLKEVKESGIKRIDDVETKLLNIINQRLTDEYIETRLSRDYTPNIPSDIEQKDEKKQRNEFVKTILENQKLIPLIPNLDGYMIHKQDIKTLCEQKKLGDYAEIIKDMQKGRPDKSNFPKIKDYRSVTEILTNKEKALGIYELPPEKIKEQIDIAYSKKSISDKIKDSIKKIPKPKVKLSYLKQVGMNPIGPGLPYVKNTNAKNNPQDKSR